MIDENFQEPPDKGIGFIEFLFEHVSRDHDNCGAGLGPCARHTRPRIDQGHLSEHTALADDTKDFRLAINVLHDLDLTGLNDIRQVTLVTLLEDRGPRLKCLTLENLITHDGVLQCTDYYCASSDCD